jgi:serine/threonine-protein kinase RsbW
MSDSDGGLRGVSGWQGRQDAPSECLLRVPAHPLYLALVGTVVKWLGRQAGLSDERCQELEVAVDEACTNVILHAFPEHTVGEMSVRCSPVERGLAVTIADRGRPFDLEEGAEIAREKRSRDPASGGMGLSLIRQLADAVHYRRDPQDGTQLTLVKYQ